MTDRALGVTWDAQEDVFRFNTLKQEPVLQREQSQAKRSLFGTLEDFSSRFQSEARLSF